MQQSVSSQPHRAYLITRTSETNVAQQEKLKRASRVLPQVAQEVDWNHHQ